jgi:hypothetical protein
MHYKHDFGTMIIPNKKISVLDDFHKRVKTATPGIIDSKIGKNGRPYYHVTTRSELLPAYYISQQSVTQWCRTGKNYPSSDKRVELENIMMADDSFNSALDNEISRLMSSADKIEKKIKLLQGIKKEIG